MPGVGSSPRDPSTQVSVRLCVTAFPLDYDELERWTRVGFERGSRSRHGSGERAASVPVVSEAPHGTSARWHSGCRCSDCRRAHSDTRRSWSRARAQQRLPNEVRQQLSMRSTQASRSGRYWATLGLTPNQVWGLTQTDREWSAALEAALTATRRDDLEHGTNAAYVAGCVCSECREHQRVRMARNRASSVCPIRPRTLVAGVENAGLDLRGDTVGNMSSRIQTRRRRRLVALVLVAVAAGLVVVEPPPNGSRCCSRSPLRTASMPATSPRSSYSWVAVGLAI